MLEHSHERHRYPPDTPDKPRLLRWGVPARVPGFTFTSGNVGKILASPLYLFGAIASVFVRRNPSLWVFGSGSGVGEGALELLAHTRKADPHRTLVWLARNQADVAAANALGIAASRKSSPRGFGLTLRAGLVAITHGFGDVNRFGTRGAFVVQLWHGIPLKHIGLDAAPTFGGPLTRAKFMQRMLRRAYRKAASNIDLFPTASELSAVRIRGAFGLPADTIAVTGDPRDDVLLRGTENGRRVAARARLATLLGADTVAGARLLLYAPTWRDGEADPGIPTLAQWQNLHDWLITTESVLLVRPHPHGVGDYAIGIDGSERIFLLDSSMLGDITPSLPAIDVLITDYSSIAFDFALTGRPIAFLAPDVESYVATRGLYEPYSAFSGGTEVSTWDELLALLTRADDEPKVAAQLSAHSVHLADQHHPFRDGQNTDRVYAEIISRLKERE
jgi:CDP-glycerol glycerophosphotransferase (TagB/SpsB family)